MQLQWLVISSYSAAHSSLIFERFSLIYHIFIEEIDVIVRVAAPSGPSGQPPTAFSSRASKRSEGEQGSRETKCLKRY